MKNIDMRNEYMFSNVHAFSKQATCNRGRVACLFTNYRGDILSYGAASSPAGCPSCDEAGHLLVNGHCVRTIHAEQKALARAARYGISLEESTLYVSMTPCPTCAKSLIEAGIEKVVCEFHYKDKSQEEAALELLRCAGIEVSFAHDWECTYDAGTEV